MSEQFAVRFMHFALEVTGAERGLAVDTSLNPLGTVGLDEHTLNDADFTGVQNVQRAILVGTTPYIANNMILDPNAAPVTNTNFANLRLVVVFLLGREGAVYLDRHVRSGAVDRGMAEQLQGLADGWIAADETHITLEVMRAALRG